MDKEADLIYEAYTVTHTKNEQYADMPVQAGTLPAELGWNPKRLQFDVSYFDSPNISLEKKLQDITSLAITIDKASNSVPDRLYDRIGALQQQTKAIRGRLVKQAREVGLANKQGQGTIDEYIKYLDGLISEHVSKDYATLLLS